MSKVSQVFLSLGLAMTMLTGCEKRMYDASGNAMKAKAVNSFFKTHQGVIGPELRQALIKKDSADYITAKGRVKKDSLRNAVYFRYIKGDTILAGRAIREPHQVLKIGDIDSVFFAYKGTEGVTHRTTIYKGVETRSVIGPDSIPLYNERKISRMNDAVRYIREILPKVYTIEPAAIDITGDYKKTWDRYQNAVEEQMGLNNKGLSFFVPVKTF